MASLSARSVYLILSGIIILLFLSTGAFYLLNLNNDNQEKISYQDQQTYEVPETTPLPPTPEPEPEFFVDNQSVSSSSAVLAMEENSLSWEAPDPTPTATPSATPKATAASKSAQPLVCNDTCSFSYQCGGDLECVQTGTTKHCRDTNCSSDSACGCNNQYTIASSQPQEMLVQEVGRASGGVMGATTPEPNIQENLPAAGTEEITLALLITGLSVAGLGFAWIRLREYEKEAVRN